MIGIDELVQAVRILLNGESADACGGLDRDRDGVLSVAELVVGVLHALYGCAALALTDGVFDANVFYGPAIIFFGPAAVHEDAGGTVALAIEYGVGRSITARGRLAPDGALRLVAERRDAGVARLSSGTGSVRVIDATYRLEALLEERELPLVGISLVREVRGTPAVWAGDYDLTLMRERGAASTVALSVAVASSGFGRCEGQGASEWAPDRLRAGACSVSPFGGFHFATALLAETGGAEEIVLSGLLEDHDGAVTGHGNWGVGADGTVLGSWSAVRRSD